MSLNLAEKAQTAAELQANQRLTGRTPDALAADLGFTTAYLDDLLHLRPAIDPADVWLLRDHLEREVLTHGGTPVPYTVLTEPARAAATTWFNLRRLP
ncbi:DUF2316 family protein [Dactylosporangium sp. NPDC049742]|uniref:DUF2316 family protein n=1 Tax=Dactylosporangium sp. NPDC049742 TaxID=3154737 RepID=UPI00342E54EA